MSFNDKVWTQVMKLKKNDKRHHPRPNQVANDLREDELVTIVAVVDFFGGGHQDKSQVTYDLWIAKYRVFDWLAMCVMGRIECREAVQVLVHSFLKVDGDVDKFIEDLREVDYDIVKDWEKIDI